MNKYEQIQKNLKHARLNKDEVGANVNRQLISDIDNESKRGTPINDALVIKIVKKHMKSINECRKIYDDLGDVDMVNKAYEELGVLNEYLPKQLSEDEITTIIRDNFENINIGECMKYLKENYGDQVDGKLASSVIRSMV